MNKQEFVVLICFLLFVLFTGFVVGEIITNPPQAYSHPVFLGRPIGTPLPPPEDVDATPTYSVVIIYPTVGTSIVQTRTPVP